MIIRRFDCTFRVFYFDGLFNNAATIVFERSSCLEIDEIERPACIRLNLGSLLRCQLCTFGHDFSFGLSCSKKFPSAHAEGKILHLDQWIILPIFLMASVTPIFKDVLSKSFHIIFNQIEWVHLYSPCKTHGYSAKFFLSFHRSSPPQTPLGSPRSQLLSSNDTNFCQSSDPDESQRT